MAASAWPQRALRLDAHRFMRRLERLEVPCPAGLGAELQRLSAWAQGGASLVFCHGDVSPANVFVGSHGACLTDFEFACYQPAALEGVGAGWPFPLCLEAGGVPAEVLATMRQDYFAAAGAHGGDTEARATEEAPLTFLIYHWTHSFPEVGIPVSDGGARAAVRELFRTWKSGPGGAYPLLVEALAALDERLAATPALAPDAPIPFACFGREPPIASAHASHADEQGGLDLDVAGVYEVNRWCRLVVRPASANTLTLHVDEFPSIGGTLTHAGGAVFVAANMPYEVHFAPGGAGVRDVRTGAWTRARKRATADGARTTGAT